MGTDRRKQIPAETNRTLSSSQSQLLRSPKTQNLAGMTSGSSSIQRALDRTDIFPIAEIIVNNAEMHEMIDEMIRNPIQPAPSREFNSSPPSQSQFDPLSKDINCADLCADCSSCADCSNSSCSCVSPEPIFKSPGET